jgi:hypothetical protein
MDKTWPANILIANFSRLPKRDSFSTDSHKPMLLVQWSKEIVKLQQNADRKKVKEVVGKPNALAV